jgi:preprotein translocase subunit SecD
MSRALIASLLLPIAGCFPLEQWDHVPIELRLAEKEPMPGLVEMTAPNTGATIYVSPDPILTNADIRQTSVQRDQDGKPSVGLQLHDASGRKMARATTEHVGRPVIWIVDGRPVAAHTVVETISTNLVIAGGGWTQAEAEAIAGGIKVPPPPKP